MAGLLALVTTAAVAEEEATLIPDEVREATRERVEADHYRSVIIGVSDGGRTEWAVFGRTAPDGPAPDPDTVFEVGSLTKPFTAALLAVAVENGDLSLDTTVGAVAGDGSSLDSRLRDNVRLWQLATHLSGLPNTPDDLRPADTRRLYEDYSREDLADFLSHHPLASAPGEDFTYSNLGYALLGDLLARHYETDFATALRDHVTGPLELENTFLSLEREGTDRLAPGYDYDLNPVPPWTLPAFRPAAALKSSARDLLRWTELNTRPPEGTLGRALARLSRTEVELGGNGEAMGLGWKLDEQDGHRIAWHTGRTAGHAAFAGFDRDSSRAVVVLANTANSLDTLGFAILVPERRIPPVRAYQPLPPHVGALYAGRYRMTPGYVVTVHHRENGLFVQAPGRPGLRLYSIDGERFFTRGVNSEVHFVEGPDGTVRQLQIVSGDNIHQIGHRMRSTETPASREIEPVSSRALRRHAGHYRADDLAFEVTADEDRLMVSSGDGPARPIYPAADGRFFHRSQPLELLFTDTDEDGTPQRLILYRNGFRIEAERVDDGD